MAASENFPARPAHLQTRAGARTPLFWVVVGFYFLRRGGTRAAGSAAGGSHLCGGSPGGRLRHPPSQKPSLSPRSSGGSHPAPCAGLRGSPWGNGPPGPRVLSPGPCLSQRRKASCWARARAAARPTGRPGVPGRPPPRFLAVPAATWVWYPVLLRQRRERAPPSRCGDSPGCSSLGAKENLGRRRVSRRNDRFQKNEAASSFSLRAFIACGLGWINTSRRRSG